jgi:hypothetical protein
MAELAISTSNGACKWSSLTFCNIERWRNQPYLHQRGRGNGLHLHSATSNDGGVSHIFIKGDVEMVFTYVLQHRTMAELAISTSKGMWKWSSLTYCNIERWRNQSYLHQRGRRNDLHLLSATSNDGEISHIFIKGDLKTIFAYPLATTNNNGISHIFIKGDVEVVFTYFLQHRTIAKSAISSSKGTWKWSSPTLCNIEQWRNQPYLYQIGRGNGLHLLSATSNNGGISNIFIKGDLEMVFTYMLQHRTMAESAISSSKGTRKGSSLTNCNGGCWRNQSYSHGQ